MKTTKTYRQGDILLRKIDYIPAGATKVPTTARRIVLGEGETPGHRHEIKDANRLEAYRRAEGLYLDVQEEVMLNHPEHAQIALLPGTYEVIRQFEFQRKEFARVQD